jgi:raffinose/stachyose/melibiose transport system substrate-binding protein
MGSGPLYGIPSYGEFVSFFYNKDMFAKAGVAVPTSMADLEAVMARFKSQGITPQCQAAGDYNATHLLWGLAAAKGGSEYLKTYFGLTAPLDTSASSPLRQAAQTIVDWTGKGYLDKKSTGLNTDAAWDLFLGGKCPMSYTGTWRVSSLQTRTGGFQWGQFLMPGSSKQVGAGGNLWVVPKKAKNKSLAYDWIELTLSKNVQTDMANKGGVAVAADVSAITDPVGKYENETFGKLSAEDAFALYGDWPVPNFYQVIQSSTQALIGGSQSVDQFLGNLKTAYDQFQSTLG